MAGQARCQPENRVHNVGATLLSILYLYSPCTCGRRSFSAVVAVRPVLVLLYLAPPAAIAAFVLYDTWDNPRRLVGDNQL